jgi:hypothetical protein
MLKKVLDIPQRKKMADFEHENKRGEVLLFL